MNDLDDDSIDIIFSNVKRVKDIRSFIMINKRFNERYKDKIDKYRLKVYANKDYPLFYEYLQKYTYTKEFMDEVIARVFMNIPKMRPSPVVEMYDLRYIFELMFKGYALNGSEIKDFNFHFYIHFYDKIKDCLDQDRKKTLEKIEKCSYLFSLKQNPKIKHNSRNSDDFIWISLNK